MTLGTEDGMESKKIFAYAIILLSGIVSLASPAGASDELYLCGIIQETSPRDEMVTVDVASGSCKGPRKFKLPPARARVGASLNTGERKCFFVDTNHCQAGSIHTITKITSE